MQAVCVAGPSRFHASNHVKAVAAACSRGACCESHRRLQTPAARQNHKSRSMHQTTATTGHTEPPNTSGNSSNKIYSKTLNLPQTKFPMRADAPNREKLFRKRTTQDLYDWQWKHKDRPLFVLQDGPPFANASLHAGHALNKILKDIIVRYKTMRGYRVCYIPGWDCHGLPIEHKVMQEMKADHRQLKPLAIRRAAKKLAEKAITTQKREMQDFALMANWDNVYHTFDKAYEIRQLRVFQTMVEKNLIYRAAKPVLWSPSSRTALAEAEIQYDENHVSTSAFVRFPVRTKSSALQDLCSRLQLPESADVSLVIWTTTPWTLPANMFVAYGTHIEYVLVKEGDSEGYFLLAGSRLDHLLKVTGQAYETVAQFSSDVLADVTYQSPFQRGESPMIPAPFVSNDSGTGLVHCAPAHGMEDNHAYMDHFAAGAGARASADVICPVDEDGEFSADRTAKIDQSALERLRGKAVLDTGSREVNTMLEERGLLLATYKVRHKYPYDWRTKQPVIFRMTPQWFANLEHIKADAIAALADVTFVPEQGRHRLDAFVRGRSEWCFSRQRAWGVPIPVIYDAETGEPLITDESLTHIIQTLDEHGTDHWWSAPVEEFVCTSLRDTGRRFVKGTDTMDVWFDSGTAWSDTQTKLQSLGYEDRLGDVYLEGSDQHRGWFQSSLLTSVAINGKAPFKTVVTHGFVLDEKGVKMSKSLGNIISPLTLINGGKDKAKEPAYGADNLRFWAASAGYTNDVHISGRIVSTASENLRKIRNTMRFILGNLNGVESEREPLSLSIIDRAVLHELAALERTASQAYDEYVFSRAISALSQFCGNTLSSFYFETIKDSLYADALDAPQRFGIVYTLRQVLAVISSIIAPVAPHLAEDVWQYWPGKEATSQAFDESAFHKGWMVADPAWLNEDAHTKVAALREIRGTTMAMIESVRQDKLIGSSAEAEIDVSAVHSDSKISAILLEEAGILSQLLVVSRVNVSEGPLSSGHYTTQTWSREAEVQTAAGQVSLRIRAVQGLEKCPRCWLFTKTPDDTTCHRCDAVLV